MDPHEIHDLLTEALLRLSRKDYYRVAAILLTLQKLFAPDT